MYLNNSRRVYGFKELVTPMMLQPPPSGTPATNQPAKVMDSMLLSNGRCPEGYVAREGFFGPYDPSHPKEWDGIFFRGCFKSSEVDSNNQISQAEWNRFIQRIAPLVPGYNASKGKSVSQEPSSPHITTNGEAAQLMVTSGVSQPGVVEKQIGGVFAAMAIGAYLLLH